MYCGAVGKEVGMGVMVGRDCPEVETVRLSCITTKLPTKRNTRMAITNQHK